MEGLSALIKTMHIDYERASKNVLVVAAHPDDENLGCGGTIARHADAGDQVQVLIVAEGATSRQHNRDRDLVIAGTPFGPERTFMI